MEPISGAVVRPYEREAHTLDPMMTVGGTSTRAIVIEVSAAHVAVVGRRKRIRQLQMTRRPIRL